VSERTAAEVVKPDIHGKLQKFNIDILMGKDAKKVRFQIT